MLPPSDVDQWTERSQRKQFVEKNQSEHRLLQPYRIPNTGKT